MTLNNYELLIPNEYENNILQSLDGRYIQFSEMSQQEREFLNALIIRKKPVNLLEIGVSAGASSCLMLNAIKDNPAARLVSIDYCEKYYHDKTLNAGFIAGEYPQFIDKWKLYTGGMAYKFLEDIKAYGGGEGG
jgi:hypothetical protein